MKRNLTLIAFILNICLLNAQQTLILPENSNFHDLPGDHFMVSNIGPDKVYLSERDGNGIQVWKDSIEFSIPVEGSDFLLIRFGNTDQYAAILHQAPSQSNAANIYQFSTFDISTHALAGNQVDTIPGVYTVIPLPKTDTSIYLFFPWGVSGFETKSLNSNMVLLNIAPKDSLSNFAEPENACFRWVDDFLWKVTGYENFMRSSSHTSAMAGISEYETEITSIYLSPVDFYRNFVNDDSLLLFTETIGNWRFIYLNKDLTQIREQSHWVPTVETTQSRFRVRKVLVNENLIYVHAYNPLHEKVKVFIYDMNLDPVCEIPVSMIHDDRQTIEIVNGKVYFRDKPTESMVTLYEIDGCMFTSGLAEISKSDFVIYPNPASDFLKLEISENLVGLELIVLDQLGNGVVKSVINNSLMNLDVNQLSPGVYFIQIDGMEGMRRFVKL